MAYTFSSLFPQGTARHAGGINRWTFEVDRSPAPGRVAWRWERCDEHGRIERSSKVFASFADCAQDAYAHGFDTTQPYALSDKPRVPATAWGAPQPARGRETDDGSLSG